MYLLRRAALRAVSASPSTTVVAASKPRTFTSLTGNIIRPRQQQWAVAHQRRFNSDETARPTDENTTDETVTESRSESEQATANDNQASSVYDTLSSAAETAAQKTQDAASSVGAAAADAFSGLGNGSNGVSRDQFRPADPEGKTTLYVGNLFFQTTDDQLRQEFSRFGNIVRTTIIRDPAGLSRGFGYVEFESEETANEAIVHMNQRVVDGRRLSVQPHKRRSPTDRNSRLSVPKIANPPSKTLFIGNMSFEMSDRDLNDLFREIRNVLDVRVAIDRRTGQPRGFAHADFLDETSATKALEILSSKEIYGRRLRVDYTRSSRE